MRLRQYAILAGTAILTLTAKNLTGNAPTTPISSVRAGDRVNVLHYALNERWEYQRFWQGNGHDSETQTYIGPKKVGGKKCLEFEIRRDSIPGRIWGYRYYLDGSKDLVLVAEARVVNGKAEQPKELGYTLVHRPLALENKWPLNSRENATMEVTSIHDLGSPGGATYKCYEMKLNGDISSGSDAVSRESHWCEDLKCFVSMEGPDERGIQVRMILEKHEPGDR